MDGVTVLAIEQTYTPLGVILLIIGISGLTLFGGIAIATLDESLPFSCLLIAVSCTCLIFCFQIPKSETRYKVIIDDRVTFNELSKRYDVVKIDGKIFTLVEKECVE